MLEETELRNSHISIRQLVDGCSEPRGPAKLDGGASDEIAFSLLGEIRSATSRESSAESHGCTRASVPLMADNGTAAAAVVIELRLLDGGRRRSAGNKIRCRGKCAFPRSRRVRYALYRKLTAAVRASIRPSIRAGREEGRVRADTEDDGSSSTVLS